MAPRSSRGHFSFLRCCRNGFAVVPARAGTHTPRRMLVKEAGGRLRQTNQALWFGSLLSQGQQRLLRSSIPVRPKARIDATAVLCQRRDRLAVVVVERDLQRVEI